MATQQEFWTGNWLASGWREKVCVQAVPADTCFSAVDNDAVPTSEKFILSTDAKWLQTHAEKRDVDYHASGHPHPLENNNKPYDLLHEVFGSSTRLHM